jgi:hypothetical protein
MTEVIVEQMSNSLLTIPTDVFLENYAMDIRNYVEKKQTFSYLSWAHAIRLLKMSLPNIVVKYKEDENNNSLLYGDKELGYYSLPYLTDGVLKSEVLFFPALDFRNKPIKVLDVFAINTTRMRGGVKAIAKVTGLGLSLYAGEDLFDDAKMEVIKRINTIREELEALGWEDTTNSGVYPTYTMDELKAEGIKLKSSLLAKKINTMKTASQNLPSEVIKQVKDLDKKSLKELEMLFDQVSKHCLV